MIDNRDFQGDDPIDQSRILSVPQSPTQPARTAVVPTPVQLSPVPIRTPNMTTEVNDDMSEVPLDDDAEVTEPVLQMSATETQSESKWADQTELMSEVTENVPDVQLAELFPEIVELVPGIQQAATEILSDLAELVPDMQNTAADIVDHMPTELVTDMQKSISEMTNDLLEAVPEMQESVIEMFSKVPELVTEFLSDPADLDELTDICLDAPHQQSEVHPSVYIDMSDPFTTPDYMNMPPTNIVEEEYFQEGLLEMQSVGHAEHSHPVEVTTGNNANYECVTEPIAYYDEVKPLSGVAEPSLYIDGPELSSIVKEPNAAELLPTSVTESNDYSEESHTGVSVPEPSTHYAEEQPPFDVADPSAYYAEEQISSGVADPGESYETHIFIAGTDSSESFEAADNIDQPNASGLNTDLSGYNEGGEFADESSTESPDITTDAVNSVRVPSAEDAVLTTTSMFTFARLGDFAGLLRHLSSEPGAWELACEARDADGHSLLHWAGLFDATDFVSQLCLKVDTRMLVNACSHNGQSPIMWAALKGNLAVMRLLYKDMGANLTLCDSLRADACVLATQHHQHNAILLLHKWRHPEGGCHPMEHPDTSGCTTAHWAAYKGDTLALRLLFYLKTNVNLPDHQGMTPLHRAVGEGWVETCQFLVSKCHADIYLKNAKNESAWDIAKRLENQVLLSMWSQQCDDTVCEDGHHHKGQNEWAKLGLPVIFVACTSIIVISFLSDYTRTITPLSIGFIMCVLVSMSMFVALFTGDPGIVPKRFAGDSAIEELQAKLDDNSLKHSEALSVNRICFSCWEWKGLRSKHCSVCDVCVAGFDHHCGWINNCVAEKNHRQFVLMIFAHFTGMVIYLIISISSYLSGDESFLSLIWSKPMQLPSWLIHLLVVPWLAILVFHQARAITLNLNTNEMINLHRYSHFWEGTTTVQAILEGTEEQAAPRSERVFKNPFDKGIILNCKEFWLRTNPKQYQPVSSSSEIEMAAIV